MKKILAGLIISLVIVNNAYAEKKALIPPFETVSIKQEYKNLGNNISENISDAFNETSLVNMIENNQSNRLINELGLKINNLTDDKNAIKLAKYFSADYIVPGNIEINDNKYILEVKIFDLKDSKKNKTVKVEGANIADLQNKIVLQILSSQGIKPNEAQKNRISKYINSTKNIKALNYYLDGINNLEKHSYDGYDKAFISFGKAYQEDKSFHLANLLRAKSLIMTYLLDNQLKKRNTELLYQAEDIFNQSINQLNYKDYKDVYKIKSLIAYFKDEDNNAKQNIKKALSYNPYDSESIYISWIINDEKNTKNLEHSIKQNPFISIYHSTLGDYYQKNARLDDATSEYQEALKLSANNSQADFGLANLFLNTGRLDESIIKYNEILKNNKNIWSVYSGLASAYRYKDMLKEASDMYLESIKLNPNNYQTHLDLGTVYTEQGELDKAIEEYNTSIKLKPDNSQTHYYLGTVYKLNDNIEQSIQEFKEAIKLKPDFAEAYYNMGVSYKKIGKLDDASNSYKQSIKINPNYPESYLNLGNIYIEQNKLNDAVAQIKQAIKLKTDYSRAYNSLGSAYQKQGNMNEAINNYKQAIKLDPKFGSAYYNLSIVYREQKKVKEAIEELKRACSQGYAPACLESKNP